MKSIEDTLKTIRDITNALPAKINIAIIGGVAAILHGIERTTIDIDFCVYSDFISNSGSTAFFELLKQHLPKRFKSQFFQGSTIQDDPFKHDVIFIEDREEEFERVDFVIAQYKWELEGIREAITIGDIPIPVLSKPHLAAMKLRSSGYKDAHDVVGLMDLMTEDEKNKTRELAARIGRDKKLSRLLSPPPEDEVREIPEEYLR
jgi:hypothetical protein